jgi:hypothetical protein
MLLKTSPLWGCLAIFTVCHALERETRGPEDSSLTLESERLRSTRYDHFDHFDTDSSLDLVANSGVCETTQNVKQYSGYLSVGPNMNMWFWFFEARHDPKNAPTAAWFNGGPGCSSMIGLFSVSYFQAIGEVSNVDRKTVHVHSTMASRWTSLHSTNTASTSSPTCCISTSPSAVGSRAEQTTSIPQKRRLLSSGTCSRHSIQSFQNTTHEILASSPSRTVAITALPLPNIF